MDDEEESILHIDKHGNKRWKNKSEELHRIDGPAVEYADGRTDWYLNGLCHRLNAPAHHHENGNMYWYQNGKLHRIDGPAVKFTDYYRQFYLANKGYIRIWYREGISFLTKEEFFDALTDEEKVIALYSEDFHNA